LGFGCADQRFDLIDQCLGFERFGDVRIGAALFGLGFVKRLTRACQQTDRNRRCVGAAFEGFANLIAIHAGHLDVDDHDVGFDRFGTVERFLTAAYRGDRKRLAIEGDLDRPLHGDAVIGD